MRSELPNEALIQHLLNHYYRATTAVQNEDVISSYWRPLVDQFEVWTDDEGRVVHLAGVGFGEPKWGGRIRRLLGVSAILAHLTYLPHRRELIRLWSDARRVCGSMGLDPTFDVFRQVCTLQQIRMYLGGSRRTQNLRALMIGDGYGVLAALIKHEFPDSTITLVDIGQTLLFQALHLQRAYPHSTHASAGEAGPADFVYCPADELEQLDSSRFTLAANIASMQEMTQPAIERYFTFLRSHLEADNLFYCCNRESKTLPGGGTTEFCTYPWSSSDRDIVDGPCPWHRWILARRRATNGPRALGFQLPFVGYYDGPHRHRLTVLATE